METSRPATVPQSSVKNDCFRGKGGNSSPTWLPGGVNFKGPVMAVKLVINLETPGKLGILNGHSRHSKCFL